MLNRETLQQLRERYSDDSATQHLYVLADHSGLPDLSRALRNFGIQWTNVFGDDRRPELLQASPLLFELPQSVQMAKWIEEHANFSHSVLFIASPLPTHALASRLALRCDGTLSDGIGVTIRYFDTRVFPELLAVLNDDERAAWLGCATGWWYQQRNGGFAHVASEFHGEESKSLPLSLTDEQMATLIKASEPDQVSDLLTQYTPHQFLAMSEPERHGFVEHMIARASSIGITALRDYAMYGGLMLLKGPAFDQSRAWTELRGKISDGELTLSGAIEHLDEEE